MTQEDKELLMKDLCARLPYSVQVYVERDKYAQATLLGVDTKQFSITFGGSNWSSTSNIEGHHIEQYKQLIKPYLRPMSSMTKEEEIEWYEDVTTTLDCDKQIDFYNKYHFDYRGLIEKGLALEAPENMYNN